MKQYISKAAVVADIDNIGADAICQYKSDKSRYAEGVLDITHRIKHLLDTLEVKEVDEQKERMSECPYRQVGCKMYEGKILECNGACGWVVDHLNLKELKEREDNLNLDLKQ